MNDKDFNTLIELVTRLNKGQYERLKKMLDIAFEATSEKVTLEMDDKKKEVFMRGIKEDTCVGAYPLSIAFKQ